MSSGWVKLHRSMFDNDLWTAEPFTKGQAWIDLIGNANHKPASIWVRGIEVRVNRGQIAWSELTMSKRWKWSRNKVRRYLKMLKEKGMAEQQTNKVTSVVTICNYGFYQGGETTERTTSETTSETTEGQQKDNRRYTNKNDKKEKNGENTSIVPAAQDTVSEVDQAFDVFWQSGLRKQDKKKASAAFKRKAGTDPLAFAENLSADIKTRIRLGQMGIDKMHPTTYLNGERWEDEYPSSNAPAINGNQNEDILGGTSW